MLNEKPIQTVPCSQALFVQLFAGLTDCAVLMLDPEGKIVAWNQGNKLLSGYTDGDLLGKHVAMFDPADAADHLRLSTGLNEARHCGVHKGSSWRRRTDDSLFWANVAVTPVVTPGGEITGFTLIMRDMTEEERLNTLLEQRVQERTAQLEQLNHELALARDRAIEASSLKSKFVANISHEIRTPMSGVLGMAELLLTCELDDEARELAQYIFTSARSLVDVVNDLLDFSKLEAGKLAISRVRFAVPNVVQDVVQAASVSASHKGLSFDVTVDEALPAVLGDPGRIRQVLLNLVHNAVKFTQRGGVTLSVALEETRENTVVVRFTVKDTGIGISAQNSLRLFNPFEQADGTTTRRYGGTGLGLSICKSLVKLMLGEIGFASEEGNGSTFWFWVPLEIA